MPLFMDRHDVSPTVTAEIVAQLHHEDLKIQHLFNCRGLTYWFDEKRKTAFCLVEAPNAKSIRDMHRKAHGDVPNQIIEVEADLVESFLGRIEDPSHSAGIGLNIINDPAFRIIMTVRLVKTGFPGLDTAAGTAGSENIQNVIGRTLKKSEGSIVKHNNREFLVSFKSMKMALSTSLKIYTLAKMLPNCSPVRIGLSAGMPFLKKGTMFEDAVKLSKRLCDIQTDKIMISSELNDLIKQENGLRRLSHRDLFSNYTVADEQILCQLMDFMESAYTNANLTVDDISRFLGISKSKLYHKIETLTGKSLNRFIKEYRLNEAITLLEKNAHTISEIAYETGFTSLSYFSKCFEKKYARRPSVVKNSIASSANTPG